MTDREKVMQWLKTCANGCEDGCPYEYKNLVYRVECKADLMSDALDQLREQEPAAPRYKDPYHAYCGACGCRIPLKIKARYCHKCGREVKWGA